MGHDIETELWFHDLWGDAEPPSSDDPPEPVGNFLQKLDFEDALGGARGNNRQPPALQELREFVKSEKRAAEERGVRRAGVKASLSVLGSILGRVSASI